MILSQILTEVEEAQFRTGGLELKVAAELLDQTLRGQPAFLVTLWVRPAGSEERASEGWCALRRRAAPLVEGQLDSLFQTYGIRWYSDRVFQSGSGHRREDFNP